MPLFRRRDFPFPSGGPSGSLKDDNDITFDPLAVAAVLSNPRADRSAARLYLQLDRDDYKWPHTMMVGGTLPPMNTLVAHLSMNVTSIHPAITMCGIDIKLIPVRSDMIFKEFPVNNSNYRLNDLVEFRSSELAGNDFMVINMDDLDSKARRTHKLGMGPWPGRISLHLIGLANGILLLTGVAFSVLTADIWAGILFLFYALHWLASTFISYTQMIRIDVKGNIVEDPKPRYAVYQRPEGGTVIFKGRKETLERWARETMEFNKTPRIVFLHWFWMISGTMAATASVACMVNMRGYMQLGFLAVLLYSSAAEIVATQISPLELLPNWPLYEEMLRMLARINDLQDENERNGGVDMEAEVEKAIRMFTTETTKPGTDPARIILARRIADETRDAWAAGSGQQIKEKQRVQTKVGAHV
ncbi:hypothetical protein TWF191_005477 [Orbilia oligospora]|uniref:Uncharacterized protein n=1 Tax=Orbilia oligospora TaxID=2813651 RepID=A0A7C8QUS2_ORBOL|nr:hypothetical protein TWF191_005477 [Orbilia oligospora]